MPKGTSCPSTPFAHISSHRLITAVTIACPETEGGPNACIDAREAILKPDAMGGLRLDRELDRHWLRWLAMLWLIVVPWFLNDRQGNIYWLVLGDTDDNMRLMQVRAW